MIQKLVWIKSTLSGECSCKVLIPILWISSIVCCALSRINSRLNLGFVYTKTFSLACKRGDNQMI